METPGQALKRFREAAGLSQAELATKANTSQPVISRCESGARTPAPYIVARLDEAVGADGALTAVLAPAATEGLTPDDRQRINHSAEHPERLDAATVTLLARVLGAQRRLDDTAGPWAIMAPVLAQLDMVRSMSKEARGPHTVHLAEVLSEWFQFAGWLRAETRSDKRALRLLVSAADVADEIGHGTLAAQATNFMGYLARQQQRPLAVVRHFLSAHHTPGAHPAQRVGDAAQAAHGFAHLGQRKEARRMLDVATGMLDRAARQEAPGTAYWLTGNFHRLNIGLAHLALRDFADAADHIGAGLDGLPAEQSGAVWTAEYRDAYERAREAM